MRIRITKKKTGDIPKADLPEPLQEGHINVELKDLHEDKVVALLKRWRQFVNSLSNEQKSTVRKWACGDNDGCTPEIINRWSKALKGSLD
tara:strand:- start:1245 stop:1514 length:270 start_codon:yes stop_codon:yes gene_type:complete